MSDISVRRLGEDDWQEYRAVRLAALSESPEAFVASLSDEEDFDEQLWRERMNRSERLLAERGGEALGVVSIGRAGAKPAAASDDEEAGLPEAEVSVTADVSDDIDESAEARDVSKAGELFGLWVRPEARGTGVATQLVNNGARVARENGDEHLVYWVGSDNGRAVAFASGIGFRPTDLRRPMGVQRDDDSEEEIAMVLPLLDDRAASFGG